MFDKVLIANRGAIACRIARTLKRLGIGVVAVYTDADSASRHVLEADVAIRIGTGPAASSYLNVESILNAAQTSGATAIHPGYGFLAENAAFAEACAARDITFIGPRPEHLRDFGLKHTARALAANCGVPLLPGSALLADLAAAHIAAAEIGYPVMLKSTAGGGGIGMRLCADAAELTAAFDVVRRLSQNNFADSGLYLEKFVARARHIEIQIFGDGEGAVASLGERDCSLQRRHQKVVEETPAPNLPSQTRAVLAEHAVRLMAAVAYQSAGTVEFIVDAATGAAYFLEVNTRLQVEHGVTEEVTAVDLVEWMVKLAAGERPPFDAIPATPHGHAIQVRLYAEDPARDFRPQAGLLTEVAWPQGPRIDTWVERGIEISSFYDPMLGKLIVQADSRAGALRALELALTETRLAGIETNLDYLRTIIDSPAFRGGDYSTGTLATIANCAATIEVLQPGTETTVQDYPGRLGYWAVGVPPSGPMDNLAFRFGNRLLGNDSAAAGLEFTLTGPTLRFESATRVCLTGAVMAATLDGCALTWNTVHDVTAGSTLAIGACSGLGVRAYLCVAGGIDVPHYMGARATFTLGRFGGHAGRALRQGDVLHLGHARTMPSANTLVGDLVPRLTDEWTLQVIYGPHGAPDFFTPDDIAQLFSASYEVHYNSSRTGVRLIGPKPQWARIDGGEAGLHPSNIHDNAYAVGALDFTGDMPVILGPDGPSLGGFVCPAVVIEADRWKLGQLAPGDRVRFVAVTVSAAVALAQAQDAALASLSPLPGHCAAAALHDPRIATQGTGHNRIVTRLAGDRYLLIEFGLPVLDLGLRIRVQRLLQALQARSVPGVLELTPGIRSLQIHYDSRQITREALQTIVAETTATIDDTDDTADFRMPSRIVHLPLSWDDPATRLAIERYTQAVRADAPWCPSNLEFIRRINGLASVDAVRDIVFAASYLVMGLGDVYLGAPVATPLDPRHRLVTTKYNPARTWTPENAVGIGGSYLCIYGMEGPGGYQFVGRTVQMWNRYRRTREFEQPWLLRCFDQIRFFPVSAEELLDARTAFPLGRYPLNIEQTTFSLLDYRHMLATEAATIARFKSTQQDAFNAERERWAAAGVELMPDNPPPFEASAVTALNAGERAIGAHVHGSVWQVLVERGQRIAAGETLVVLESMKMEVAIVAEFAGVVDRVLCKPGHPVAPGQPLLVMEPLPI